MDHKIEIIHPLEPSVFVYENCRKRALAYARRLMSHRVNIHDDGGVYATKGPGESRITFLRR